ncbi:hypothetical protein [Ferdinandcohnia sp. SAFN-114]|uniref:hypothetical protein n=1 Tax=Ferdinandcohnia sp. SAFN-114 TaxID=3387275 RepID=UPI003F7ED31A
MGEVRKAKIKCDFENGFSLSPDMSTEEALQAVLDAVRGGTSGNVKLAVEYMDNTETNFEMEEEEEEEEEED